MEINYKDLGLTVDKSRSTFDFNGIEIEISNYLPAKDKYDLIMITVQKSFEDTYFNAFKLKMYLDLYCVIMYTNILFPKDKMDDLVALYDELVSSGFMNKFKDNLNEDEYNELFNYVQSVANAAAAGHRSAGAVLQSLIQDLPKNAETAVKTLKQIDPEKVKELMSLVNLKDIDLSKLS